jgi:hypothetical protein
MQSAYASSEDIFVENGIIRGLTTIASDLSARIITVKIGAYEKRVEDYVFAPSDLVSLSPAIDEAAGIEKWLR